MLDDFVFFLVRPRDERENMHIRIYSTVNGHFMGVYALDFRAWCQLYVTRERVYILRSQLASATAAAPSQQPALAATGSGNKPPL